MIHKAVLNGQVWHCTFGVSCRFYSWVHEVVPPQSSIRWSGLLVLPKDNISLQWVNLVSHLVRQVTKVPSHPCIFSSLCRVWSERSRRKSAFWREVILHVAQSFAYIPYMDPMGNGRNNDLGMGIQNFIPSIQSHPPSPKCPTWSPRLVAVAKRVWSNGELPRPPLAMRHGMLPGTRCYPPFFVVKIGEIWPGHYGSHWSGGLKFWHPMAQWSKFRASQGEVMTQKFCICRAGNRVLSRVLPRQQPNTIVPMLQVNIKTAGKWQ